MHVVMDIIMMVISPLNMHIIKVRNMFQSSFTYILETIIALKLKAWATRNNNAINQQCYLRKYFLHDYTFLLCRKYLIMAFE